MRILYLLKNKSFILAGLAQLVLVGSITAQDYVYEDYSWDKNPTPYVLPDTLSEEEALYTKYHYYLEFNSEVKSDNQQLNVEHYKLYLNSDKAVEANNKIYIPQEDKNDKHNKIMIRVIQPDGSVTELDKKDIKTGVHEESGTEYLYYAIEDLKIGSEIEALIKTQVYPTFFGRLFYIQKNQPVYDYTFEYIAPEHLEMEFKVYNSEKEFVVEENEERVSHTLSAAYVPKYESETLSNSDSHKEYLLFKLNRNIAQGSNDVNSFGYYSQVVGNRGLNAPLSKSAFKSIAKSYKDIGIEDADSDTLKALKIENYIKQNFTYIDNNREATLEDVDGIFKQKAVNIFGATRLYIEYLYNVGMTCQMIVTCDKTRVEFDKKFENYLFLNKTLLYIPEIKMALDPSDPFSRLQYFDTEYQNHPGLFIRSREVGSTTTATGKVKMIPTTKGSDNLTKAIINVDIIDDFDDIKIKVETEKTGHVARNFQPYFQTVEDDLREEFYGYVLHTYTDQLVLSLIHI